MGMDYVVGLGGFYGLVDSVGFGGEQAAFLWRSNTCISRFVQKCVLD